MVDPDVLPAGALPRRRLDELPTAARETIEREARGRAIAEIASDTIDGHPAYAVQFRERRGNPWIHVSEDGVLLRPLEKPPAFGLGTTLSDTPVAVRQTLQREVGRGEIVRIDKQSSRDRPDTYHVTIDGGHGTYQLKVSADGRVLGNTRPTESTTHRG